MPRRPRPTIEVIRDARVLDARCTASVSWKHGSHRRCKNFAWWLDARCTASVSWKHGSHRRCKNFAWWPDGRCSRHFDPAWTFGDWLAGWVTGSECGLMPGLRLIEIEGRVVTADLGEGWLPMRAHANFGGIRPTAVAPRIVLRVGNRSSGPLKTRAWASAEDAQVQVDQAMAAGQFDPSGYHGERVLHRLAEVVSDAQVLTEWMQRDGAPVPELSTTYVGQC